MSTPIANGLGPRLAIRLDHEERHHSLDRERRSTSSTGTAQATRLVRGRQAGRGSHTRCLPWIYPPNRATSCGRDRAGARAPAAEGFQHHAFRVLTWCGFTVPHWSRFPRPPCDPRSTRRCNQRHSNASYCGSGGETGVDARLRAPARSEFVQQGRLHHVSPRRIWRVSRVELFGFAVVSSPARRRGGSGWPG